MALFSPSAVTSEGMMSIAERRDLGGSLNNLTIYTTCEGNEEEEEEPRFKEKKGLLRRAFSSRKKKKKKVSGRSPSPSPGYLTPRSPRSPNCLTPNRYISPKQPLRQVRSNPYDGGPCFNFESSPASDLAARRGVFSRRHYGSVELLISSDTDGAGATTAGRFRVETGEREGEEVSSPVSTPVHLENPESQTRWYFKYFLGKLHQNYVGCDAEKEPFLLSVVVTDANNHNVPQYRAVLWKRKGAEKRCLPYNPNKPMTVKSILSHFDLEKIEKGPKEIFNPEIQKELLVLEEQEGSVNFKFGVIYSREGQTSDDEMYSTEHGSPEFYRFCNLLGDRIRLKGWEKYRGGLDTKSDMTGKESYYTVYEGHEIMFHVSTLLPYSRENKQQVERKRHIGNDIVNIVYVECDPNQVPSFKPSMMKTHFTHIYAVVTYNKDTDNYRLWVYSEEAVRLFGPPLPCPAVWSEHYDFRDFLLVKLINGEKAAFNTPVFAQKRQRTLEMLIKSIYQDHMPESSKNNMLNRRAFSDIIPENVSGSRRKEEARQSEFLRVGQWLKLKTILKGDAPTSLISSGALLKYQPWEPQCFLHDFSYEIICGDSWGDKLLVATTAGTFVLEEAAQPRMIFDKTLAIKQINVVEAHGLLIFRSEKGKDGKLYVFRLTDFEGEQNEDYVRNKQDCRDHKIDKAKGCNLYAISRQGGSHLRLVASIGKRLLVMMWKHSSAWSAWCPVSDNDTVDGFQFLRELQAFEVPQLMTLVDGPRGDNQICIGYKNQFDLINEKNGDTLQLYQLDSSKCHLVSAVDIYEDDEPELLLCYNHVCHFQKLSEESSQEFDFKWNSEPESIVCAFPYIMAFTTDTVEIRLIINGSLVHTMTLPHLFLITSKCDIYFASTAADKHSNTLGVASDRGRGDMSPHSPPSSPSAFSTHSGSLNIYKIPLMCLVGPIAADKGLAPPASPQPRPQTLLSPLVNTGCADPNTRPRSPSCGRRSPLLRTKKLGPMAYIPSEDSRLRLSSNSSSCDSGIHIHRASEGTTPPVSPFFSVSTSLEEEETLIL